MYFFLERDLSEEQLWVRLLISDGFRNPKIVLVNRRVLKFIASRRKKDRIFYLSAIFVKTCGPFGNLTLVNKELKQIP